jgi:hypothetical protein
LYKSLVNRYREGESIANFYINLSHIIDGWGIDYKNYILSFKNIVGYDGMYKDGVIIAFEPNQIKSIDNKTPSKSDNVNN